jgi:teichuronic acid biosynthesis glycosyltransferase TuaH
VATRLDDVLGRWGNDVPDVLYGTDDYVSGAELMNLPVGWLQAQERRALARADIVIAISDQLADRWTRLGASPVVIPNGCYEAADHRGLPPSEALDLTRPVVGLIGQLSDRIDLDIIDAIVEAGFSLLIVGPKDPRWEPDRFADLISRPGVYFAGPVPAEEVPSYLAVIDVGITPYRDSPFNRASFPLKTLEYLSAGRPVVSTGLRSARWLKKDLATRELETDDEQILAIADDAASFVGAVRSLAGSPGDPVHSEYPSGAAGVAQAGADKCRRFAEMHSWSRRADAFASAIGLPESTS